MTTPAPSTRNITRAFRQATDAQRKAGRSWYQAAHDIAAALDPADIERGAAVVAVLSPLTSWKGNVTLATKAYAGRFGGLGGRKAASILSGVDPASVVDGPKVTAFWQLIADPAHPDAVVLDRHAVDIAVGHVTDDATRNALLKGKRYAATAELYRRAARIVSTETGEVWTPGMVQAVTWLYWRATHGRTQVANRKEVEALAA